MIKSYEIKLEQILEYSFLQKQLSIFWPFYKKYFKKRKKYVAIKQAKRLHKLIVTKIYLNGNRNWYFAKKKIFKLKNVNENKESIILENNWTLLESLTKW